MKNVANQSNLFKKLAEKKIIGIKVSFEDEGADFVDLLSVKFFCLQYGIDMTLKIGGPEAIRDLKDANKLQINSIVAPMVESKFALEKFINACKNFLSHEKLKLGFNVETILAADNFIDISNSSAFSELNSVTIGRGDLVQSMELGRYDGSVNSDKLFEISKKVFEISKAKNKQCMLGGSMTADSKSFVLNLIELNLLDKFETRNIIIHKEALGVESFDNLMELAFELEYDQMKTRRTYYEKLFDQDLVRIKRLSNKYN
jgi:hypothetical protein